MLEKQRSAELNQNLEQLLLELELQSWKGDKDGDKIVPTQGLLRRRRRRRLRRRSRLCRRRHPLCVKQSSRRRSRTQS